MRISAYRQVGLPLHYLCLCLRRLLPHRSVGSHRPHTVPIQLSAGEQATLDKLNALRILPDGPWRFHVGDITHGESMTLDDSSWQLVTAKSKAPKEAVWYRRIIEVLKRSTVTISQAPLLTFDSRPTPMDLSRRSFISMAAG